MGSPFDVAIVWPSSGSASLNLGPLDREVLGARVRWIACMARIEP